MDELLFGAINAGISNHKPNLPMNANGSHKFYLYLHTLIFYCTHTYKDWLEGAEGPVLLD